MSQHTEQVASVIHRNVQDILTRGLNDPRVRGLVSVTGVRVADDLSEARIAISVLPAEHETLTLRGLQSAAAHIRARLGKTMTLRRMPRLIFQIDKALKKQAGVFEAISRASSDAEPSDDATAGDPADSSTSSTRPAREDSES